MLSGSLETYQVVLYAYILSELLYRYSDLSQREIGRLLGGIDYSAVNKLRNAEDEAGEKETETFGIQWWREAQRCEVQHKVLVSGDYGFIWVRVKDIP